MISSYRPDDVARYFDELGVQEWNRLVRSPTDEVSLYIHTHYLKKYMTPGQRVLEIGAGAGRFTQILGNLGAQIVVADISGVQLDLNRKYSKEYGFSEAVLEWKQIDICDMSAFESASFDCIVAYGGPFSYVLDKRDIALGECMRVLKSGGILFLSVMSLFGSMHRFFEGVLPLPPEINQKIMATGDLSPATYPERPGNFMHMFRASELMAWLEGAGLTILDKSASNCITVTWNEKLMEVRNDEEKWNEILRVELEACADEGCINLGTHIIAVTKKL